MTFPTTNRRRIVGLLLAITALLSSCSLDDVTGMAAADSWEPLPFGDYIDAALTAEPAPAVFPDEWMLDHSWPSSVSLPDFLPDDVHLNRGGGVNPNTHTRKAHLGAQRQYGADELVPYIARLFAEGFEADPTAHRDNRLVRNGNEWISFANNVAPGDWTMSNGIDIRWTNAPPDTDDET